MIRGALRIAGKDLKLVFAGGVGVAQPVLLGLLLIFVFSLSRPPGDIVPAQAAAGIFWLASMFGQVLIFNTLYNLEEANGARLALLMAPVPTHAIWLGKALAGLLLLLLAQIVFVPAAMVFLGRDLSGIWLTALLALIAVDWGVVVLGSLLGALSQGRRPGNPCSPLSCSRCSSRSCFRASRSGARFSGAERNREPRSWGTGLGWPGRLTRFSRERLWFYFLLSTAAKNRKKNIGIKNSRIAGGSACGTHGETKVFRRGSGGNLFSKRFPPAR